MKLRRSVVAALVVYSSAALAQPPARSAAQGVADISTSVCFELASGGLVWQPRDLAQEMRQIEAAGLTYGVPEGVIDRLGPMGQTLVNRATLASRTDGASHVILAMGGTIPGCRVLLSTDSTEASVQAVEAALVEKRWLHLDPFDDRVGALERHFFVRIDNGRSYTLRLGFARAPSAMLRLFTTVEMTPEMIGTSRRNPPLTGLAGQ